MSLKVELDMPQRYSRPTRKGSRRRPRNRQNQCVRPSQVYREALEISFARMAVIDRLRMDGFKP
jgi:hypothetical protein